MQLTWTPDMQAAWERYEHTRAIESAYGSRALPQPDARYPPPTFRKCHNTGATVLAHCTAFAIWCALAPLEEIEAYQALTRADMERFRDRVASQPKPITARLAGLNIKVDI